MLQRVIFVKISSNIIDLKNPRIAEVLVLYQLFDNSKFSFKMQSTYCASLHQHCETIGRAVHIVNLDPAAENFDYPVAMGNSNYSIAVPFIFRYLLTFTLWSMDVISTQTSRNLYLWMMLWKNLDWVQMVLLSTAWSILVIWNFLCFLWLGSRSFSTSVIAIINVCILYLDTTSMPFTLHVQTSRRKFGWLVGRRVGKFCRRWLYCFWLPRYILCLIIYCELFSLFFIFKTRTINYKILNLVFWRIWWLNCLKAQDK